MNKVQITALIQTQQPHQLGIDPITHDDSHDLNIVDLL